MNGITTIPDNNNNNKIKKIPTRTREGERALGDVSGAIPEKNTNFFFWDSRV